MCAKLGEIDADLIFLQESWVEPNGHSQAAILSDTLGLHSATAFELSGFDEYPGAPYWVVNAILCRWPVSIVRALPLNDEHDQRTWRHVLIVEIDRPQESGGRFFAAGTHLEHGLDRSPTRCAQMRNLLLEMSSVLGDVDTRRASPPAVVAGDFNAVPWSDEIRRATGASEPFVPNLVLVDAWEACGNEARGDTWSSRNPLVPRNAVYPNRRLDYVTTTAPRQRNRGAFTTCHLEGIEPIDGVQPSDHYAVVAEVSL